MNQQHQVDSLSGALASPFKDFEYLTHLLITQGARLGWNLLSALITLVIGFWLAKKINKIIENRLVARDVDPSVRSFITPIFNILLRLIVVIFVVGKLGLNASGFIAALGGAGLAIGLALQGSLSNFASGLLIILFKPFKVGDYISSQGNDGTVESISILNTVIVTIKGQVITLPNSNLFNNPITNYSMKESRRVDINIAISYEDDFDKAQKVLLDVFNKNELVDKTAPIVVEIAQFADSGVNLAAYCTVKNSDFLTALWQLNRATKYALDANNISIPYPHTQVVMQNDTNSRNNTSSSNNTNSGNDKK